MAAAPANSLPVRPGWVVHRTAFCDMQHEDGAAAVGIVQALQTMFPDAFPSLTGGSACGI